jgi:hypothetical protein
MANLLKKQSTDGLPDLSGLIISNQFKLKHPVGKGAHGLVYRGKDIKTDMSIAVKVVCNIVHIRWEFYLFECLVDGER